MTLASIRFSGFGGGLRYRLAEVLSEHPNLDQVRVQFLDNGQRAFVSTASIAWCLFPQSEAA